MIKGLTNLCVIFSSFYRQTTHPKGFTQHAMVAKTGGNTAKVARAQLEKKLGCTIISSAKITDAVVGDGYDSALWICQAPK